MQWEVGDDDGGGWWLCLRPKRAKTSHNGSFEIAWIFVQSAVLPPNKTKQ